MRLIDVNDAIKKLRNAGVKMHTINGVKAVDLDVVISFLQSQPVVRAVPIDGNFGVMQTCAIRYACGRRTYMPSLVIDYITPLIPHLDDSTLAIIDKDLAEAAHTGGYGDPQIDEPGWKEFHALIRQELTRRGCELYKSWRGDC